MCAGRKYGRERRRKRGKKKGARRATLDSPAVRLQADHASYSDIIY